MVKHHGPPMVTKLRVKNFRALRDVELDDLSRLTVLTGPNGSGKSTVFDVFAFLAEAFQDGLRAAVENRNRMTELRSRGTDGPIVIEFKYRDHDGKPLTYHLEVSESSRGRPRVSREWLSLPRPRQGKPPYIVDFVDGKGSVIPGDDPGPIESRVSQDLASDDLLAVSALGQLANHPRIAALRSFITGWYLSYLTADSTRTTPTSGPAERLSRTGDNLPNVVQYLVEEEPDGWARIQRVLAERVPRLQSVVAETLQDNRLLLQVKDAPFDRPVLSKFASDGTLKLLAYLTVLYDPRPAPFVGIEEPENQLHPTLLPLLAEECQLASARSQLLVTTHSPEFLDGLAADDVWVLARATDGYTRVHRVSQMPTVMAHLSEGASLSALWREGYFEHGHPLRQAADA